MDIYSFLTSKTPPQNSVVIECGCHTGTDTRKLANLFPTTTLHAIEANTALYTRNVKTNTNSNCVFHNMGLSNINGPRLFYIDTDPRGDAGASSFLKAHPGGGLSHLSKIEVPQEIQCITLPSFIEANKIENVFLLWLDVEQHEFEILEACDPETLKKIQYIYTEVNYQELRKGGKMYEDIFKFLTRNGFQEVLKAPQGSDRFDWQANCLFARIG
jgi:FkbM family methyltransferase